MELGVGLEPTEGPVPRAKTCNRLSMNPDLRAVPDCDTSLPYLGKETRKFVGGLILFPMPDMPRSTKGLHIRARYSPIKKPA